MARPGSGSGERKRRLTRSLEYRCVRRFRLRRLLSFLWRHSYDGAYEALSVETNVFFRAEHLRDLVRQGQWKDARTYLYRFVPLSRLPAAGHFIVTIMSFLSEIARYKPSDPSTFPAYDPHSSLEVWHNGGVVNPGGVKLAQIIRSACCKEAWLSINWPLVRLKAADIIGDLLDQIPEFNELRRLPRCPVKPANVLPVGLSSSSRTGFRRQGLGRMPADALARSFLSKKRLYISSSQGPNHAGLPVETFTMGRLAEVIDECLQAGKRQVLNDKHPIEASYTEGMKHPMFAEAVVHQDTRATEYQESKRLIQESDI